MIIGFLIICWLAGFVILRPRMLWQIVSWSFVVWLIVLAVGKS